MAGVTLLDQAKQEAWSDLELVRRVLAGETALYELIMRRYNQRLYRVARAILRNDAEAEDVMQDAHVRAYQHLADFENRAQFSTWLTRIAIHEALARSRRQSRFQSLDDSGEFTGGTMKPLAAEGPSPEEAAYDRELRGVLERAVVELPEDYRLVFMLREVEGMSTDETADCLSLSSENVKVRLHRARATLRKTLFKEAGGTSAQSFQFHAPRCDRVVANVFRILALPR